MTPSPAANAGSRIARPPSSVVSDQRDLGREAGIIVAGAPVGQAGQCHDTQHGGAEQQFAAHGHADRTGERRPG